MDALKRPPSGGKDDPSGSAAATAGASRPGGDTSRSLRPLTRPSARVPLCAQEQDCAAAAAKPASKPHPDAVAAEKRAASRTEYDLVAARLRRRRTRAPFPAQAPPASSTKASPSAARNENEAVPAGDRNPKIGAAANSSGSACSAAGEAAAAGSDGWCRVGSVDYYEKIAVLGEGGFGTVWKARNTRTGDLVAIKSGKTNKADAAALLREAALLAACRRNPAVVGFRELVRGPGADDLSIVMDLVTGTPRNLLDRRRRFSEPETRELMRQLLAGVAMMGAQGIVHGDLKPDNVLVRKADGGLLICDLGLAISVSELPCHIEGTHCYAAPEQLLGEKNCSPPVDAWALGCVMAELLTGKLLVEGFHRVDQFTLTVLMLGVPDDVSQMSFGVDASAPSDLRGRVPEELLTPAGFEVLQGLLQYDQQKRLTPAMALQMPWFAEAKDDAS